MPRGVVNVLAALSQTILDRHVFHILAYFEAMKYAGIVHHLANEEL